MILLLYRKKMFGEKKEFCKYYAIETKTFERWKKKGEIPVNRLGGQNDYFIKAKMHRLIKAGDYANYPPHERA